MFSSCRRKLSNKLLSYVLKNNIENKYLLRIFFVLYFLLLKFYNYDPEYKDENHHYIPRLVLNNFKIGNVGEIYQYEKNTEKPKKISIKKEAACFNNYYTTWRIDTKKRSIFVEKEIYGFIEQVSTKIFSKILSGQTNFSDIENSVIALYASFQYTRTPAFKNQLKNFILFLIEERKYEPAYFSNKNKDGLTKLFINETGSITRKELVEFNLKNKYEDVDVERILRNKIENLNSLLNFYCVQIANYISEKIFRKKLYILDAKDPFYFILPDCGVMVYDFNDSYDYFLWPYGWDIKRKSTVVFMPISPNKCLLFNNVLLDNNDIIEEHIKLAITLAYHQKHKYIFSDRDDKYIQGNINKFPLTSNFK